MLAAAIAFTVAGILAGAAFLASYVEENGFPDFSLPRFALAPVTPAIIAPAPTWCECTRRWRNPVTRAFVKAPAAH